MSDHPENTVTMSVTLDQATLCRAARLGGLAIALDEAPTDQTDSSLEQVCQFAKLGITHAIHDSFDRLYPPHYPDDVRDAAPRFLSMEIDNLDYQFLTPWKGKVTW
ncbi:MAG TPA: hypothetical protein DCS30_13925 [Rhizobiales bacterium]|mgnify:CR=1 FL=1|nr:hypothetical protein [Hyphomicrobiales bacterium]